MIAIYEWTPLKRNEGFSFQELRMGRAKKSTPALRHTEPSTHTGKHTDNEEEDTGPMALWTEHGNGLAKPT